MRILIADDDPDARVILAIYVRHVDPDAELIEAVDGAEAVVALQATPPPDLAILDYQMPYLCGLQLAELARKRGIPTVVVSSHPPLSRSGLRDIRRKDDLPRILPQLVAELRSPQAAPPPRRKHNARFGRRGKGVVGVAIVLGLIAAFVPLVL